VDPPFLGTRRQHSDNFTASPFSPVLPSSTRTLFGRPGEDFFSDRCDFSKYNDFPPVYPPLRDKREPFFSLNAPLLIWTFPLSWREETCIFSSSPMGFYESVFFFLQRLFSLRVGWQLPPFFLCQFLPISQRESCALRKRSLNRKILPPFSPQNHLCFSLTGVMSSFRKDLSRVVALFFSLVDFASCLFPLFFFFVLCGIWRQVFLLFLPLARGTCPFHYFQESVNFFLSFEPI